MTAAACAEIVRKHDPDRFLATMAATAGNRAILFPIYAFNAEISRAAWVSREPDICKMRLQWWRDALQQITDGKRLQAHEVLTPLAGVIDADAAPVLIRLIEARHWDVGAEPFHSEMEFEQYLKDTAGGLMWVAARALGCRGAGRMVREVGYAAGLANWLRAVPELRSRGRAPLPDPSLPSVAELARGGLELLKQARRSVPKAARPATRTGWLAGRVLNRAAANPDAVAGGGLHISEFSRRSSLLLRVALGRP